MKEQELKEVAEKLASYGEAELQKLSAILLHDCQSLVGLTADGDPVPPDPTHPHKP
jgi:hypothetical protein